MRGPDAKQEAMFSYISPEKRAPSEHPPRPIREMVDDRSRRCRRALPGCMPKSGDCRLRPSACCAPVAADLLLHPKRAAPDGAIGLQSAVPLVRGHGDGRAGLGSRSVQQEPGAAAERRDSRGVLPACTEDGAASYVGRALHRGWHADRGLGEPQEFSPQG